MIGASTASLEYRYTASFLMRRVPSPAVLLATAVYFVLTVALTWPLILHPGGRVPNDLGDPLLNTWLMAWNARVLPLTEKWWNAPQFFPADGAMAFSEHLLGLSWITTPVIWLSGNPLLGYNAAFFLSFPLCALSAYFLTYSIARRHDCAFVAGLAFGFAPYRMAQFAHVQVLSAYWMPLALAGLHRYFQDRPTAAGWCCSRPRGSCRRWRAGTTCSTCRCSSGSGCCGSRPDASAGGRWRASCSRGPWRPRCWRPCCTATGRTSARTACGGGRTRSCRSARTSRACSRPRTISGSGAGSTSSIIPSRRLFPGVTPILLIIAGLAIALEPRGEGTRSGQLRIARVLVIAGLVFAAVAASPLYFGPWKIEIAGLRLLSVGAPHKPLSIALLFFAVAGGAAPVGADGVAPPFGADLLCAGGGRDVAVQPRARADADGPAHHLQGSVCLADDAAGSRRRARAGAVLDARRAVPVGGARGSRSGSSRARWPRLRAGAPGPGLPRPVVGCLAGRRW